MSTTVPPPDGQSAGPPPVVRPAFAHESEAELARILDFYAVRWEYEPDTFPILWDLDGDVLESFAPDFYLPDLDLYVELTTLKQRLVRKKNRKLRRLRELYPDVRIKLFYARDFRALMLKYGKLALADGLSGTVGQVVPVRGRAGPGKPAPDGSGEAGAGADVARAPDGTRSSDDAPDEPTAAENLRPTEAGPPPVARTGGRSRRRERRGRRSAARARTVAAGRANDEGAGT